MQRGKTGFKDKHHNFCLAPLQINCSILKKERKRQKGDDGESSRIQVYVLHVHDMILSGPFRPDRPLQAIQALYVS